MLQGQLNKKFYPLLLGFIISPAFGAFFSGSSSNNEPSPPPSNIFGTANESSASSAPRTGRSSPSLAPSGSIEIPDYSQSGEVPELNAEQVEKLNAVAKQIANDPSKLTEIMKEFQKNSQDSNQANSNVPAGESLDELEQVKKEIENIQRASSSGEKSAMEDQAFKLLLEKALPMSPDQIKLLRKLYDITQQASATTPNAPPTPKSSSSVISLEPGMTPPVIRTSAGFVTSVVFSDSTGAAWPIVSYTLGDPSLFNIQWDQKSNTLFIQSLKAYAHGNLAITLFENPTPVMLSLVSGQREVDFRIDYQIAGRGPAAVAPIMTESLTDAKINPILINILDGIPPKGSVKLNVSGNLGNAWLLDDTLYFRSKLVVLSPAWISTISSPDGTHVYEMKHTPSILVSKDGQTIDLRLTGL